MNYYPGQPFMSEQIWQGYAHVKDTTHFLFDSGHYGIKEPERVILNGSFRHWSPDVDDPHWMLHRFSSTLYILSIYNPHFYFIPPGSTFKFMINDGQWMHPRMNTANLQNGNLIFMPHVSRQSLYAEIRRDRTIWVKTTGIDRSFDPNSYELSDALGHQIPIASALPQTYEWMLLSPSEKLDIRRVYYLSIKNTYHRTLCSFDGWFRDLYSPQKLGAEIEKEGTYIRIFSPRADAVKLYLYRNHDDTNAYQELIMNQDTDGVWEAFVPENLKGVYYDFTVHGPDDPGNHFYHTTPVHISDPYARVSMDTWGKSRIWEPTVPATPLKNGRPPMEDVIAYEVHIQDFTDLLPLNDDLKGTIPAMGIPGLKNQAGEAIGFDYLVDLGINVIHLMPVQEFLHYKDEVWKPVFEHDPFMIANGVNLENYQWGYRTSHCFAIESRFRQKGTEPGAERDQFRNLVQAFHDKGIAVIIDIVPNHTAENMDTKPYFFHFNVLDKQYYYRTNNLEHLGEYGNEVKTENRPMVQRWLIDQCQAMIDEFGIDGFRIDLAGQIDKQTLITLRQKLGPDIIIYGEPWIDSFDPNFEANPSWDWYKVDSPITFFNDESRNAFKGPTSIPRDKRKDRGYAGGNTDMREMVKWSLAGSFPYEKTPLSGINYLDIHDNWTLADQFAMDNWDGRYGVDEFRFKIAVVLLYTSLGPIVINGGTEIMRSKGVAELTETIKYTADGTPLYFHGKRDTYNMRKANQFVWENVGKNIGDEGYHCNYRSMYEFWKGFNKFRLSERGRVFRQSAAVPEDYYQWIEPENRNLLGYIVDNQVMVAMNVYDHELSMEVNVPIGNWMLIGNQSGIDHIQGVKDPNKMQNISGGAIHEFRLSGAQFNIWLKLHE